jgi:L-threonylcarbamoyladenylate synthase
MIEAPSLQIIRVDPRSPDAPRRAVQVLLRGGLVAFPTDTYYALGARVDDEAAVDRVITAKQRPPTEPMPVLVADRDQWRAVVTDIPEAAARLADQFWPGALTIVCRRAPYLPPALTGGRDTIGARQPNAPLALGLCRALGMPIVGTSANIHEMPAPIIASQVALDLGDAVDLILDGGRCPVSRPSTVVDVTRTPPVIIRAGAISAEEIRGVLGAVGAPG